VSGATTPAGWYPDPTVPGQERWWDGAAWTEAVRPVATPPTPTQPPPPPQAPAPPPPPSGPPPGAGYPPPPPGPGYSPGSFPPPPGPAPIGYGYPQGAGFPAAAVPPNYLAQAILVTLFCCLPAGIVAIVKASQVSGLWARGDAAGAKAASDSARTWSWISFGVGFVVIALYVIAVAGSET